ncbi:MAG: glutamate synthase large subunit [Clostridiales Family XIII bacterium]|jgi:glutamate synthase (ferredoxin)|nr:glutamate synthase large subunit [Clostridiales Family XIII bacterium]
MKNEQEQLPQQTRTKVRHGSMEDRRLEFRKAHEQGLYDPKYEHDACGIGMIVNIDGRKTHKLIDDAVEVLKNMAHRGGLGSEPETGDGAGILLQIPHEFFKKATAHYGIELPEEGEYGVAMLFASPETDRCRKTVTAFSNIIEAEGMKVLGVRKVPLNHTMIGKTAREVCPSIRQIFIAKPEDMAEEDFERKLYIVSKLGLKQIRKGGETDRDLYFYLSSISCRTIVYKGMLRADQLSAFYLDLKDTHLTSSIVLVHSRFSTNTFPSWERAHPMRYIIHNGEINTIQGNANWVKAREAMLKSEKFGDELSKVMPTINEDGSDSAMLDDFIKLLVHAGYSLPEAIMLTIPEPWETNDEMDPDVRAFYEYNSCIMEPWDGPAAIAFTDGRIAGATLDRNGLRPSRYYLTKDNTLILASEAGVLPIPAADIVKKDRLRPGMMLLIDTEQKRIIEDAELKKAAATAKPYRKWLDDNLLYLDDLPLTDKPGETWQSLIRKKKELGTDQPFEQALIKDFVGMEMLMAGDEEDPPKLSLLSEQKVFGYTWEDLNLTLKGIADTTDDPISSMGIDTPLAVLSNRPQLLYNYFKQHFAQVTNPPIDAIREQIVTASDIHLGRESNLLEPDADNCRMIRHSTPIMTVDELQKIRGLELEDQKSVTLPIFFDAREKNALQKALDNLFFAADIVMDNGYNILILSDRGAGENRIPIPALLATSALHHYLVREGTRTKVSLIIETGEAREAHHLALLIGYGAEAVCPYLAYETLRDMASEGWLKDDADKAVYNYRKAMSKAIIKIMSKMGISTVQSYHGAQIFEALGVSDIVIDEHFTGTTSRIGGVTLKEIEQEARIRHAQAFDAVSKDEPLDTGGDYKWRKDGEYHLYNPENIYYLQQSCRSGSYELFKQFTAAVNTRTHELKNIRGLLSIVEAEKPISIDTVESVESIVKRFKTGAMSYGSISQQAHECMAIAMNRLGGKSNTGEGGELTERFTPDENGDSRSSAIKQVASGRFGVTLHYLNNAKEIQIKMAQGAKPGEGGHLPGGKVYPWIAKARYSTPGVELISPPPHHDIYSIEDLAQLIRDLKAANDKARISVKLVSEAGVGTIAVGVAKGLADVIVVSGYDGGTGAAPRTSIRHAGLPWELGIAETHQSLLINNMRNRVVLETDGKLLTGRDIVIAALLGAEEFAFATAPLVVMGCDMMRVCNLDTCPVGIATHNPDLCNKFVGKPEYIENLMLFLAQEVREWMSRIGVRTFNELVGHAELLRQIHPQINEKSKTVDLSRLLYQPKIVDNADSRHFTHPQDHGLRKTLDRSTLISLCWNSIRYPGEIADYALGIINRNRTVGCMLSAEIVRRHGSEGLPDGSIHIRLDGSAGQSFGAFLTHGVELDLHGDSNDYIGKGLSGGRIIVTPPDESAFKPSENVIIGNTALYGATSGEVYIRGVAGERFCVRNSGATAVVEGVGDHACEYMTGGTAVILGATGRNFAAGMSGGIAYVLDEQGVFTDRCNTSMVSLTALEEDDRNKLKELLEKHERYTGSDLAARLLTYFPASTASFVKVFPNEYRRILLSGTGFGMNTDAAAVSCGKEVLNG